MAAEGVPSGGRRAIASDRNALLLVTLIASQLYLLVGPPLFGSPAWTALLPVVLTTTCWALIHEAIHGLLFVDPGCNAACGRLLSIIHGAPFTLLRMGHLLHHRYSRTADISEAWRPAEPRWQAMLRHYGTILGGLYGVEVASGLLLFLPVAVRERVLRACVPANDLGRRFLEWQRRPDVVREGRLDTLLIVLLFAGAGMAWGAAWPWLLLALAGRGLLIAFFDNAYHYGTAVGDPGLARNHRLPAWASVAILHFNFHGTHHRHAAVPWHLLPVCAAVESNGFEGGYFSQAMRQLRGAIAVDNLPRLPGAADRG